MRYKDSFNLLMVVALTVGMAIPLFVAPTPIYAGGWLEGYAYRQKFHVAGSSAGVQSDYPISLTVVKEVAETTQDWDGLIRGFDMGGGYETFTIVEIPDPQGYPYFGFESIALQQMEWIAANTDTLNIKFVTHVGDMVSSDGSGGQWSEMSEIMTPLDGVVPWLLVPGNHDYDGGDPTGRLVTDSNTYFPTTRFSGYSWFGADYPVNSMRNSYGSFTAAGIDFIVLGLEFGPTNADVAWAEGIIEANLDKKFIIFTHSYMDVDNTRMDAASPNNCESPVYGIAVDAHTGEELWTATISQYSNIVLVISGHQIDGVTDDWQGRRVDYVDGQPVTQALSNFQGGVWNNGGNGWLRYYVFDVGNNEIDAYSYTDYLKEFNTDDDHQFTTPFRSEGTHRDFVVVSIGVLILIAALFKYIVRSGRHRRSKRKNNRNGGSVMISKLLRQRRLPFIGGFVDALYTSLPILGIINFLSIMVILYNDTKPYLLEHMPWVTLWMFLVGIGSFTSIIGLLIFKFVLPALWTFRSKQMFNYENKIDSKLDEVLEKLEKLEKGQGERNLKQIAENNESGWVRRWK